MQRHLLISVRHHDGRHHAEGQDPLGPARLFQALVAGAGASGPLNEVSRSALMWLEGLPPPLVAAPHVDLGQRVKVFLPNNDLDHVGGDPRRIAAIRKATQFIRPRIYQEGVPFLYAWSLPESGEVDQYALVVCDLADRLYQFGRGVDMAWACGEVVSSDELHRVLSEHGGVVHQPTFGNGQEGLLLACPAPGSLSSLESRYDAASQRFKIRKIAGLTETEFRTRPEALFREVRYDGRATRRIYELYSTNLEGKGDPGFFAWPVARVVQLVEWVRDAAADRLRGALPGTVDDVERFLVGRTPEGLSRVPAEHRIRLVPLPSTGHQHVDRSIRRVAVEVPGLCPLHADDVFWAFSGLSLVDRETGEVGPTLVSTSDNQMMARYVGDLNSRIWRTATPVAVPERVGLRKGNSDRHQGRPKGTGRIEEEEEAKSALVQAMRHAKMRQAPVSIHVQREAFAGTGERAEMFAQGTRFQSKRLWHVELRFDEAINGPLLLGDGRFLGLGLFEPVPEVRGVYVFEAGGLSEGADPIGVARALRRAVMGRVQATLGRTALPAYFSGHGPGGTPARSQEEGHLSYLCDLPRRRLLVVAPHVLEHRDATQSEKRNIERLSEALRELSELRAGNAGLLLLRERAFCLSSDALTTPMKHWETITPYQVTRHVRSRSAEEVLAHDIRAECRRIGIPEPTVHTSALRGIPNVGLVGHARLEFKVAVRGPLVLGKSRFFGGGLFQAMGQ